jgi:hypothetical protein
LGSDGNRCRQGLDQGRDRQERPVLGRQHRPLHGDQAVANPPTRKAEDEAAIKKADEAAKTGKRPDVSLAEGRLLPFKALDEMGKALKAAGVARLSFTNFTSGAATRFMDRLAKLMGVEVACFKETTVVYNDEFDADPKDPTKRGPIPSGASHA